jgi:hypothetical protein
MDLDTRQRPSEAIMRKKPYGKDVLFIHSYLLTRTVIGAIGVLLPVAPNFVRGCFLQARPQAARLH